MTQITAGPRKFQTWLKFPPSVHLTPGALGACGGERALIFIQMYMCVGADVSGGNVVVPLSSVIWRGRLYCQLSVFRGLCHLENLSENTFSKKGLFGRQRWWWLEKEASSFRRLSPEGGRGVNLVFDRAPAHDY